MEDKRYWLASWIERYPDGTVQAFRTAIHCETLARAVQVVGAELHVRANANHAECLLYNVDLAYDDAADLVGKVEVDTLGLDEWPE